MQTIVTMTSWVKRIKYVAKFIYGFFTIQTVKPDVFYLWLAVEEFPNKENDLPKELLLVCNAFNVHICWTEQNEYCFKRWYVYPKHYTDLVISIDDDILLSSNAIDTIQRAYAINPVPQVLHYKNCGGKIYIGDGISYKIGPLEEKSSVRNYFQGNCAFTPNSFPLDSITDDMVKLRKILCPKCDESWLHPFLIKNNIPITFIDGVKWRETEETKSSAISNELHRDLVEIEGSYYKRADIYKYLVVNGVPNVKSSWVTVFPNYDCSKFKLSQDSLLKLM